jgi:hypothetical protein
MARPSFEIFRVPEALRIDLASEESWLNRQTQRRIQPSPGGAAPFFMILPRIGSDIRLQSFLPQAQLGTGETPDGQSEIDGDDETPSR